MLLCRPETREVEVYTLSQESIVPAATLGTAILRMVSVLGAHHSVSKSVGLPDTLIFGSRGCGANIARSEMPEPTSIYLISLACIAFELVNQFAEVWMIIAIHSIEKPLATWMPQHLVEPGDRRSHGFICETNLPVIRRLARWRVTNEFGVVEHATTIKIHRVARVLKLAIRVLCVSQPMIVQRIRIHRRDVHQVTRHVIDRRHHHGV